MRIGFIQGRLSPQVNGKIQAFPWDHWRDEFAAAHAAGFRMMEWTLDQERIRQNPFMTAAGRAEIKALSAQHGLHVVSLTGDCFMQAPFYKTTGAARAELIEIAQDVIKACTDLGVRYIIFPLVDNGRLDTLAQEDDLVQILVGFTNLLSTSNVKIVFESDFPPERLRELIARFPRSAFGINYDIGNSASLGFKPVEEFASYGERVDNVHVKDRLLGGTTVPLGTGNADFASVFRALKQAGYGGNYILQTARAADGDHAGALRRYRDMVVGWLTAH